MFLLGTGDPCEQIKLRNPSIYGFGGAALWLKPMAYLYLVAPLFIIATLVRLISPLPSPVDRGLIGVIGIIGAIRVAGEGILLLGIVEILNILARTPVVNRKFEAD